MFKLFKNKKNDLPVPTYLPFNTDMHSHILPGIDDGAPDIKTSLELIESLYKLGIMRTIATPHIIGDLYRNNAETINTALNSVKAACKKRGIGIEISAAAEYMLDDYFMELLKKEEPLLTIYKNIILTEIPFTADAENLKVTINAITAKGYVPILAHPERYNYFQENVDGYFYLKEIGFKLQINLLSLTGYYGIKAAKAAKFIVDENLTSLVGTDLHHHRHLAEINSAENRQLFEKLLGNKLWNDFDAVLLNISA